MSYRTNDPDVVIVEQDEAHVRYRSLSRGKEWDVFGRCVWSDPKTWGPCGEGAAEPPPGPPEGRLDIPVLPGFECSLCVDEGHLRVDTWPE